MVQQGQDLLCVLLRKPDEGFTLDKSLRLQIRRLHDELIDGRTRKLSRLFQGRADTIRHAGGDSGSRPLDDQFNSKRVPLWHRIVQFMTKTGPTTWRDMMILGIKCPTPSLAPDRIVHGGVSLHQIRRH